MGLLTGNTVYTSVVGREGGGATDARVCDAHFPVNRIDEAKTSPKYMLLLPGKP